MKFTYEMTSDYYKTIENELMKEKSITHSITKVDVINYLNTCGGFLRPITDIKIKKNG